MEDFSHELNYLSTNWFRWPWRGSGETSKRTILRRETLRQFFSLMKISSAWIHKLVSNQNFPILQVEALLKQFCLTEEHYKSQWDLRWPWFDVFELWGTNLNATEYWLLVFVIYVKRLHFQLNLSERPSNKRLRSISRLQSSWRISGQLRGRTEDKAKENWRWMKMKLGLIRKPCSALTKILARYWRIFS